MNEILAVTKLQSVVRMFLIRKLYQSAFNDFLAAVQDIQLLLPSSVANKHPVNISVRPSSNEFMNYSLESLLEEESRLELMILNKIKVLHNL